MSGKIKILIADDHELVRQGIRHTLEADPQWEVAGEAADGQQAVDLSAQLQPDIVILDLTMPALNGLDAIPKILQLAPHTRILVLSIHDSDQQVLAAGAKGYLLKSDAAREMISAIQSLAEGRVYFTAKVSQTLLDHYLHRRTERRAPASQLTTREQEIVRLVAQSKTNKEVASLLNISVRTVESHRSNIMEKLGLHSLSDLIRYAIQNKLSD